MNAKHVLESLTEIGHAQYNVKLGDTVMRFNDNRQLITGKVTKIGMLNEHGYALNFEAEFDNENMVLNPFIDVRIIPPATEYPAINLPLEIGVCRTSGTSWHGYQLFSKRTLKVVSIRRETVSYCEFDFQVGNDGGIEWCIGDEEQDSSTDTFMVGLREVDLGEIEENILGNA